MGSYGGLDLNYCKTELKKVREQLSHAEMKTITKVHIWPVAIYRHIPKGDNPKNYTEIRVDLGEGEVTAYVDRLIEDNKD